MPDGSILDLWERDGFHFLLRDGVQLGIVEGTARRTDLHYLPFMEDEIILAGGSHAAAPREGDVYKRQLPALAPSGIFRTTMLRAGKAALTKTIPLPTKKPAGNDLPHQL